VITQLGVASVIVDTTETTIRRFVPTSNTAWVNHRSETRGSPRAVIIPIIVTTTFCVDIDGAVVWITHGWFVACALFRLAYDAVRANFVAADASGWVSGGSIPDARDRTT
jgi:hypothetical protein